MKLYIQEKTEKTVDGEKLQVVNIYTSKPNTFTYLAFTQK